MNDHIAISISPNVDQGTSDAIEQGLDRYNEGHLGPPPTETDLLWTVARDTDQRVVGGIKGIILWNWFSIQWVWVSEHRGRGLGSRLMHAAERAAAEKGCTGAILDTASFQAPDFYHRLGYTEYGWLDDFPPGHTRFFMRKALGTPTQ